MQNLRDSARNPLSLGNVDRAIFSEPGSEPAGSLAELDSGRVVARPTSIMAIHADPKQPRRAIPASIRLHWDGDPLEVVPMLGSWHVIAETAENERRAKLDPPLAAITFDVIALLNGEGEGLDTDKFPSITQEYLSLVRLAAGIKADGLINPITVVESDGKLLIESGERRWLAYHLLNTYLGDQWAKIPAAKGNTNDSVWRQATENTQRRALNAIGMARQIALLIMAARGTPPIAEGSPYREYEEIVTGGVSDRRYYAQVADGNAHRIPKGMGERIQGAMGLGMEQISQYRALLHLTDDEQVNDVIWTRADVENWPEGWLRDIRTLTPVKVSEVISRASWTIDDLKALKEPVAQPAPRFDFPPPLTPPRRPVTSEWMNKRVRTKGNETGTVIAVDGDLIKVVHDGSQRRAFYNFNDLTILAADRPSPAPNVPAPQPARVSFKVGDTVMTRLGTIGTVRAIDGRDVLMETASRNKFRQNIENVTLVQAAGFVPQINEAEIEADVDPDAASSSAAGEWSEGWTLSEGGNNEQVTDKADSGGQVEPKRIIKFGSIESKFLFTMQQTAQLFNDEEALVTINNLIQITDVEAIALADAQTLKPTLDMAYDRVQELVTSHFASILQQILNAAE